MKEFKESLEESVMRAMDCESDYKHINVLNRGELFRIKILKTYENYIYNFILPLLYRPFFTTDC